MGMPLIDIDLGLKAGLKVKYEAGKAAKTETSIRRDAQKAASRLPADDPKRRDLLSQAEKRVESHLGEPIELPLNAPTQAAAARASGSRKRARDPDREHEEQMAAAQSELLKLQKAVSRAETKAQHTTRTVEQKFKVLQRMSDRSLACPSATKAEAKRAKHLHAYVCRMHSRLSMMPLVRSTRLRWSTLRHSLQRRRQRMRCSRAIGSMPWISGVTH